ncbi:MAG TPA: hypothetical protein VEW42_03380 [Candidatus Eisenbacteria bacterium]|nr:hypothetical protein [Candidatus Eisenbacteria bacterium]
MFGLRRKPVVQQGPTPERVQQARDLSEYYKGLRATRRPDDYPSGEPYVREVSKMLAARDKALADGTPQKELEDLWRMVDRTDPFVPGGDNWPENRYRS